MRQRVPIVLAIAVVISLSVQADEPAAVIPGESRPAATRLEEAGKRLEAKKIDDAIALFQNVIETSGNHLVATSTNRSVRARHLAHAALSRLDAAGLALYRRKVDPQAEKLLEQWRKTGEAALLRRIVDEAFCSKPAQLALVHLGDSAFERGRFDEAEGWWGALVPLTPLDRADVDPDTLVYPDPAEDLVARTRAKQLLSRLFRGQHDWKSELEAFRKRHPKASGNLAGRKGVYADILAKIAEQRARKPVAANGDWPTFAGDFQRGRVDTAPPKVLERLSQLCRRGAQWKFDIENRSRQVDPPFPPPKQGEEVAAARRLAFHPVVVGHHALVADAQYITAYDLKTGKPETWYDVVRYSGGIRPKLELPTALLDLRYTLTVAEGCLFARMGAQSIKDVRPDGRQPGKLGMKAADDSESLLVCLSLTPGKDGDRRRWSVRAIDPGRKEHNVFEGAPVVAEGRVYIAATRFEGDKVITAIHCYAAHPEDTNPAPLWRTDVCETRELLSGKPADLKDLGRHQRNRHHLLTLAGSRIAYCSHSGAIVAVDAVSGARAWAVKYPRRDLRDPEDAPVLRDLAPCLFADGRLYVAPSDSQNLLCLDPATGATLWRRERLDVVHLLGVGQGRLIFTTWRNPRLGNLFAGGLRAVMADDGRDSGGWSLPDDGGGLVPFGRPLLLGDLVLWPTPVPPAPLPPDRRAKRFGVFAVKQVDGQQPDNPSLLYQVPSGNLVYANGCLLVTDQQTLYAFVPPEMLPDEDDKEKGALSSPEALERGRRAAARGETEQALEYFALAVKGVDEKDPGHNGRRLLEEVRRERQDVYLAAMEKASREKDARQAEEWLKKATEGQPPRYRLAARLRADSLRRSDALDADLADLIVDDEQGLPQRMAATQMAKAPLRKPASKPPVELRLPLSQTCEVSLAGREIWLPPAATDGPAADRIWSARGKLLLCRSRESGELVWKKAIPIAPEWLAGLGTVAVVAGREGIAALDVKDGEQLWAFFAPPQGRYPGTLGGTVRVVRDVLPPEPLGHFHLAGGRLFAIQGERRLLALDPLAGRVLWQRWAPGAAFGTPAPRGRFQVLFPVGADNLLVQASSHRWLLDAATGKIRHESPVPLERWPRSPLLLAGGKVCVVPHSTSVELIDAVTAKVAWTYTLPGKTTRSGEPPLTVGSSEALYVLIPENIGYRLQRLNGSTGKPLWDRPPLLELQSLKAGAWVVGPKALYHADNGRLFARSLDDGRVLWQRPLPVRAAWKLDLLGDTLIARVERGSGALFQCRWLFGSVQWTSGPLAPEARSIDLLDAQMGTLLQRINLEEGFLRAHTRLDTAPGGVFPSATFGRVEEAAAGVVAWWDDKGLLAGLGNKVKALAFDGLPSGK